MMNVEETPCADPECVWCSQISDTKDAELLVAMVRYVIDFATEDTIQRMPM